jgi:translation initiation factor 2 alpha subunit (eIF-2alpha)
MAKKANKQSLPGPRQIPLRRYLKGSDEEVIKVLRVENGRGKMILKVKSTDEEVSPDRTELR